MPDGTKLLPEPVFDSRLLASILVNITENVQDNYDGKKCCSKSAAGAQGVNIPPDIPFSFQMETSPSTGRVQEAQCSVDHRLNLVTMTMRTP